MSQTHRRISSRAQFSMLPYSRQYGACASDSLSLLSEDVVALDKPLAGASRWFFIALLPIGKRIGQHRDAPARGLCNLPLGGMVSGGSLLLATCLMLTGCGNQEATPVDAPPSAANEERAEPADLAWQQQVLAIQAGESDTLLLETPMSEQELQALAGLSDHLQQLLIDAGGLTDANLARLAPLKKLTHLRIRESQITDAGLATLLASQPNQLRILNIPQGHITAAGIQQLSKLPSLVQLRLGGRQLDDAAVEAISRLPALRALHLISPALSGKALDHLASAPRLTSLYIDDCPLPDEAWVRLFEAKPNLHVHIDQQHHDRDPNAHADP